MNENPERKFEVVIDGNIQDDTFDDEEAANQFACSKRTWPGQKIVVYRPETARHHKAWTARRTPREPKSRPPQKR